ncbi:MAG: hypothetical protein KAH99_01650 [Verrucomicrobia bacterium]|nr:hypothetical protein [Verrucomicrobiota bacterium]
MKKHQYRKIGLIACVVALFATAQAFAVDLAAASGLLADIAVASTQANAALADAANSGPPVDLAAVEKAQAVVADVEKSMQAALEAYTELEAGNNAAMKDLVAARNAALDATEGTPSDSTPPGKEGYSIPNIEDIPWQSDGLRKLYQEMSEIIRDEGGHGYPERDKDVTPT